MRNVRRSDPLNLNPVVGLPDRYADSSQGDAAQPLSGIWQNGPDDGRGQVHGARHAG